jgi:hypothetical protein
MAKSKECFLQDLKSGALVPLYRLVGLIWKSVRVVWEKFESRHAEETQHLIASKVFRPCKVLG